MDNIKRIGRSKLRITLTARRFLFIEIVKLSKPRKNLKKRPVLFYDNTDLTIFIILNFNVEIVNRLFLSFR